MTTPLRTLVDIADGPLSQEHLNRAMKEALEERLAQDHSFYLPKAGDQQDVD